MDKCRYCKESTLVLSMINEDYSCESCGQWQDAVVGTAWELLGFKPLTNVVPD